LFPLDSACLEEALPKVLYLGPTSASVVVMERGHVDGDPEPLDGDPSVQLEANQDDSTSVSNPRKTTDRPPPPTLSLYANHFRFLDDTRRRRDLPEPEENPTLPHLAALDNDWTAWPKAAQLQSPGALIEPVHMDPQHQTWHPIGLGGQLKCSKESCPTPPPAKAHILGAVKSFDEIMARVDKVVERGLAWQNLSKEVPSNSGYRIERILPPMETSSNASAETTTEQGERVEPRHGSAQDQERGPNERLYKLLLDPVRTEHFHLQCWMPIYGVIGPQGLSLGLNAWIEREKRAGRFEPSSRILCEDIVEGPGFREAFTQQPNTVKTWQEFLDWARRNKQDKLKAADIDEVN